MPKPSSSPKGSRRPPTWRVDLIGRKGRQIAFGAVLVPRTLVTARGARYVALGAYQRRFPGWTWEAA